MRISGWKSAVSTTAAILGIGLILSASATPPRLQTTQTAVQPGIELSLDTAQSKVHYVVDTTLHTVHGTFAMKSGTLQFNPESGKASGEIVVFATSGESGNSSRDERMHKEILESGKFQRNILPQPGRREGFPVRGFGWKVSTERWSCTAIRREVVPVTRS